MTKITTFTVAALFVAGCASTTLGSWVGHGEAELVSQWGAPDRSLELKDGSRVLTWERNGRNGCIPSFTVDSSGVVRNWSHRNCL